jgi:hypothetical protein
MRCHWVAWHLCPCQSHCASCTGKYWTIIQTGQTCHSMTSTCFAPQEGTKGPWWCTSFSSSPGNYSAGETSAGTSVGYLPQCPWELLLMATTPSPIPTKWVSFQQAS